MSWLIIDINTDKAVCELFDEANVARLNTAKYRAVEAYEYLTDLNLKLNNGQTYRGKRNG